MPLLAKGDVAAFDAAKAAAEQAFSGDHLLNREIPETGAPGNAAGRRAPIQGSPIRPLTVGARGNLGPIRDASVTV